MWSDRDVHSLHLLVLMFTLSRARERTGMFAVLNADRAPFVIRSVNPSQSVHPPVLSKSMSTPLLPMSPPTTRRKRPSGKIEDLLIADGA